MVHLCDGILNHAGKSNCFTLLHAATYYLKMIVAVHVCQRWFHFSCCWPKLCVVAHSLTLYETGFDSMQRKHFTSAHHSHDSHVSYCKKCKEGKKNAKSEKPSAHSSHTFIYQHDTFLSCHSTPSRPLNRSDYKAHHTFIAHLLFSFCHLLTVIIIIVRRLELSLNHLMRIIDVGCFLTIKLLVWLDFCLSQWYAQLPIV